MHLLIHEVNGARVWRESEYSYAGYDRAAGLHRFLDANGKVELYVKRKFPPAHWHLVRGAYAYEFCRSE